MLRFAVFDKKGPAKAWPLVNAHLLGSDDVGMEGEITFRKGEIVCQKKGSQAAALSLQFDAGDAGVLVLQTCLLPDSDDAYVLSHELARHRIKTFLVKCEEWQMFELAADHPAISRWEEARQLFTRGLNDKDPVKQDLYGRESLEHAIEATERLAMAHAEVLLHRRYASKPASRTTLGVRVSPRRPPEDYAKIIAREFDLVYIPLTWRDLEVSEGQYDWTPVDRWMTWAHKYGRPVIAGPLINFSQEAVPDWMYVWQHDYDTCRDMVYDHIERVVHRYRNVVSIWSVASGLNVNDNFQFTTEQMLDLTRMSNLLVRQGNSRRRGRTMLEIVMPFGEHVGRNRESVPPLTYIDRTVQEGIRFDCYGLQLGFGRGTGGLHMRDLMQVSNMLDRFFLLELPVLVTSAGVPSAATPKGNEGAWQESWTPEVQARWASRMMPLVMSKPHVESFLWSTLIDDPAANVQHAGLFDANGTEKPALKQLIDMRRRMRKPLGPLRAAASRSVV